MNFSGQAWFRLKSTYATVNGGQGAKLGHLANLHAWIFCQHRVACIQYARCFPGKGQSFGAELQRGSRKIPHDLRIQH